MEYKNENKIELERDDDGMVLPTLRNKDTFDVLMKNYGSRDAMPEALKSEFNHFFVQQFAFSGGVVDLYHTKEDAIKAFHRKSKTAELDKKYLEEKS
jgi:phosphoribosyl-AMP cyclohydrolase